MSYLPKPGSNIAIIYKLIGRVPITFDELKDKIRLSHPAIPVHSISTHLKFLEDRRLIIRNHDKICKINGHMVKNKTSEQPVSQRILQYCKDRIGKKVTSLQIREDLGLSPENTAAPSALRNFTNNGAAQLIEGTKPFEFLILPEIKTFDAIPYKKNQRQELVKPEPEIKTDSMDISNLSIGEILTNYVNVQNENKRLRESLQRIAHELVQIGELE